MIRYNPFQNAPGQLRMGLKPLALLNWLDLDEHWLEERQLKASLLQAQRDRVWVSSPGSEAAQREVLELVVSHLLVYFPDCYTCVGDRLSCRVTGQHWNKSEFGDRPLELASRLVQEDFCILASTAGQYRLVAGCVCFPSRWEVRSKLGKSIFEIHDPVPHYAETLGDPVDRLFDRLRADAPGWRLNWSLADTSTLFLPPERPVDYTGITPENVGDRLWLRVEFQTLRRLPQTQAILFTIRTYCDGLATVVRNPALREGLHQAIAQFSPETQRYKSIEPIRTVLLVYLQASNPPNSIVADSDPLE